MHLPFSFHLSSAAEERDALVSDKAYGSRGDTRLGDIMAYSFSVRSTKVGGWPGRSDTFWDVLQNENCNFRKGPGTRCEKREVLQNEFRYDFRERSS